MITKIELIPVTGDSYPFASAERLCGLSARGYCEKEYYMYGTANVYRSVNESGDVEVMTANAPYVNRFIVRAPQRPEDCSGNVVVEIINPTAFMEIDRMWILGHEQFIRNGDIYIGITSKPNTIPKLLEFNPQRYGKLDWSNPTPEKMFSFEPEQLIREKGVLSDLDIRYETGLFWDMLTDLAWLIRSEDAANPLLEFPRGYLYLTGWSQSGCYLLRYLNSFAYRPEVARGGAVFNGYITGGAVRNVVTPVSQYEAGMDYSYRLYRVEKVREPYIAVQTESENGRYGAWQTMRADSDSPDFRYRLYEVTGVSHDSMYSLVRYYKNDPDMERIHCLPAYSGLEPEGNDYPSEILFAAAFRNLFSWVRTGAGPNHCDRIPTDANGENRKDAFGNTLGGLRTCLLNYPTGRYNSTSTIPKGSNLLDPESDKNGLFGYQEGFSAGMLAELYGSLEHYRELVILDTEEQVSRGFVCREDAQRLVEIAVALAKKRGLE